MARPFVIAGLGNPGPKYAETRHNAGFWFLSEIAGPNIGDFRSQSKLHAETLKLELHGRECILVRPTTFMNDSGRAVRAVIDYFRVPAERLLVAYDELDLPPGVARLKLGGGHGGHNGLRDVLRHATEPGFIRLRIGIGHPGQRELVTPYVLSRPRSQEQTDIMSAIRSAAGVMEYVVSGNLALAQTELHTAG